jgi:hypothetical protein
LFNIVNIQDVAHKSHYASTLFSFSFIFYYFIFYIYFYIYGIRTFLHSFLHGIRAFLQQEKRKKKIKPYVLVLRAVMAVRHDTAMLVDQYVFFYCTT